LKNLTAVAAFAAAMILAVPANAGTASWYGPGFHGRTTANGERYDQNAMTCAHKTLRFGTRVKVTNLNNGKSAICRVNDRGPYAGGRVIDVSRGMAERLDMIRSGVVPVRLQILK
jgi:rare lipoprotein A